MSPTRPLPDGRAPLPRAAAEAAFALIMDGGADDEDLARFLVELAERGETVEEVAAAVVALRERMIPVEAPPGAIDVCGTGGDGAHSRNVSTAAAIVVAACGVPVAKHGNRAASSRSGAADVLAVLGLGLEVPPAQAEACLAELGIAFLFAAHHHPAMARVAPVRRALGRRTIFNLLGPLANPASVRRQLVGVFAADWVGPLAGALHLTGADRALVVHGLDGLDELSVSAESRIAWTGTAGPEAHATIAPEAAGLERHSAEALRGGDAGDNAAALLRLLDGEAGAYRDTVIMNAAGALLVAERAEGWAAGAATAAEAIDSGAARDLLRRWIDFSPQP